jgi:hypothetical protein
LDRFEWNVVQGKVVMGIHMYGARFEEQIYWCNGRLQKMYSASDKLS